MDITRVVKVWGIILVFGGATAINAYAARISDIANTKHNFSAQPIPSTGDDTLPTGQTRVMRAQTEAQICVFCHTPHAGNTQINAPLWNRQLSTAQYTIYGATIQGASTSSFDASQIVGGQEPEPNGTTKLCLSCHDGTIAVGAVNVLNGQRKDPTNPAEQIQMTTADGKIPAGAGITTGFTRYLGTDLTNDHPVSITYNQALATVDAEMRFPNTASHIVVRGEDPVRPAVDQIHLEPTGAFDGGGFVQCNSCHDPHIRSTDPTENIKFLRLNRLQIGQGPTDITNFTPQQDIICLACHEKAGWDGSAHAHELVANEQYTADAAAIREFPVNTQVWESACLACHDTHTVENSRRLLREGVDGTVISLGPNYQIKLGDGRPAIEEACYACHSRDGFTLIGQDRGTNVHTYEVPDIKTDFQMLRHMPITTNEQQNTFEVHDIGSPNIEATQVGDGPNGLGKDFIESPELMGIGNRHVECTDCHNPHRVSKKRLAFDDPTLSPPDAAGTHNHADPHDNRASGVLRGIWGVEPIYSDPSFHVDPGSFLVRRGNPDPAVIVTPNTDNSPPSSYDYVTREYQVCLKCHSNYAFGNTPPTTIGNPPNLTPGPDINWIGDRYTNIAREYQSPVSHRGENQNQTGGGAGGIYDSATANGMPNFNHRAWHPVMTHTGRFPITVRNADRNLWLPPFQSVGSQSMYCTDCHGSVTAAGTAVPEGGENGFPWGPHGSNSNFILKGPWSSNSPGANDGRGTAGTGHPQSQQHLCFKCHDFNQYANQAPGTVLNSGFGGGMGGGCMGGCMGGMGGMGGGMGMAMNNLHIFHNNAVNNFRCNLCHIAIPHGWKNKNFLVNLNDVGPESSLGNSGQVRNNTTVPYYDGPYYNRGVLKVRAFANSGTWVANHCGSAGAPGNGAAGVMWMAGSSEACVNIP